MFCPASATANADAGLCTATLTITAPSLADNCTIIGKAIGTRSDSKAISGPYPSGATTIIW